MAQSIMEVMQLRRTLWLLLQQTGPQEIDETLVHPLWRMKATRLSPGKVKLEAIQMPEPAADQIEALVEKLNGSMMQLDTAMEETGLGDYPPAFIEMRLQPLLIRANSGYWVDAAFHRMQNAPATDQN